MCDSPRDPPHVAGQALEPGAASGGLDSNQLATTPAAPLAMASRPWNVAAVAPSDHTPDSFGEVPVLGDKHRPWSGSEERSTGGDHGVIGDHE